VSVLTQTMPLPAGGGVRDAVFELAFGTEAGAGAAAAAAG